jgi:hypothetical protein
MCHAWERKEKYTRFRLKIPKEREHTDDRGVDGRMGLERILRRLAGGGWSEFIWLRKGTGGGLL